jgi:hypothetical protein
MTIEDKPLVRTAEAVVEQAFGQINTNTLPVALGVAVANLSKLAHEMGPDDVSLSFDLAAGCLSFRCYRRARP